MEAVYVGTTLQGHFCAFGKVGVEINIYRPGSFNGTHLKTNLDEWHKQAASYSTPNDLQLYDDVINATWQKLGFSDTIVKKNVQVLNTELGRYYPRIWRGIFDLEKFFCYNPINARAIYGSTYIRSSVSASSLYEYLQDLFRYVEPSTKNLDVFGNKLRELLILTCTDVEASWRAVLEENSSHKKDRYTTVDYIKIKNPLRLAEWEVSLRDYPDLGTFSPFKSWSAPETSKTLPWYQAYNAVKHHRELDFGHASLKNLINAVAAVHILQSAQWGPEIYDRFFGNLSSPFVTALHPVFDLADLYVPTIDGNEELSPQCFFDRHP